MSGVTFHFRPAILFVSNFFFYSPKVCTFLKDLPLFLYTSLSSRRVTQSTFSLSAKGETVDKFSCRTFQLLEAAPKTGQFGNRKNMHCHPV